MCIACNHLSFWPCLSRDTPSTVKFFDLNLLKLLTTLGFSVRHGPHQLAQKSTNTYLPLNELSETGLPLGSGNEKSGASLPTRLAAAIFASSSFILFIPSTT